MKKNPTTVTLARREVEDGIYGVAIEIGQRAQQKRKPQFVAGLATSLEELGRVFKWLSKHESRGNRKLTVEDRKQLAEIFNRCFHSKLPRFRGHHPKWPELITQLLSEQ